MKSNWKTVKLQELGRVVGGATPSTKNEAFYGGSIPWLTPKDLADYSERYISKGERSITEEGLNSCSTELLPAGTVLFSSRAPIGYVAIASNPICTNQGFKSVVPDTGVVDPLFLYYLLVFNKEKIKSAGSGTTFKEVSGNVMKNIEVEIPTSVDYQRKIAQILGSIDNQIESNARINKNLFEQVYSFYLKLVDQDTDEVMFLDDIAIINPKRQLKKGEVAPYIEMSSLNSSSPEPDYIDEKAYSGGMKFVNGDTLLARITPCLENGKAAYIDRLENNQVGFGSTEYIVLTPKLPNISSEFLYCIVKDPVFLSFAKKRMTGTSGRQRVSGEAIASFEMPQITSTQFLGFQDIARANFSLIRSNKEQNIILGQLRDFLLPKLLSGEIEIQ